MNNKRNYIIQCTEVRPVGITTVTTVLEFNLLNPFSSYLALTAMTTIPNSSGLSDSREIVLINA